MLQVAKHIQTRSLSVTIISTFEGKNTWIQERFLLSCPLLKSKSYLSIGPLNTEGTGLGKSSGPFNLSFPSKQQGNAGFVLELAVRQAQHRQQLHQRLRNPLPSRWTQEDDPEFTQLTLNHETLRTLGNKACVVTLLLKFTRPFEENRCNEGDEGLTINAMKRNSSLELGGLLLREAPSSFRIFPAHDHSQSCCPLL